MSIKCKQCLDCGVWEGGVLRCSKCGQMIALRYKIGDDVRIYPVQKFKGSKDKIENRGDTYSITSNTDLIGFVDFKDFDELYGRITRECDSESTDKDNLEQDTYNI